MSALTVLVSDAVGVFASVIRILLLARILLSWLPGLRNAAGILGQIYQLLLALTEPILGPLRRMIAKSPVGGVNMVIDFSPILALFLVESLSVLLRTLILAL